MRRVIYAFAAGTFAALLAAPVLAQSNPQSSDHPMMASTGSVTEGNTTIEAGGASNADLNMARYKAWDDFQNSHPGLVRELRHNPKLLRDQSFINRHSQLKDLFQANSGMREDMERNPGNYLARSTGTHRRSHHRG